METASKTLEDFIEGFHLWDYGTICFNATIVFITKFKSVQLDSPIQINKSSIKNMSTIYILNPEVIEHGIPDTIYEDEDTLRYFPCSYLEAKGKFLNCIDFRMLIHPDGSRCNWDAIMEIEQRINN